MKKLMFPIASLVVGIICSVSMTGHQTPVRAADKVNEQVIVSNEDSAKRLSSARKDKDSEANAAANRLTANAIPNTVDF